MCINIAILGSCTTRDNFYSEICSKYVGIYDCCFYQDKASIISIMSDYKSSPTYTDLLGDSFKDSYIRECNKTILNDLVISNPDYIILDFFADVHFGIIQYDKEKYFTNNFWYPPEIKNEFEQGKKLTVFWQRRRYTDLFLDCFNRLITLLKTSLPKAKIVIHRIKFASIYKNVPEDQAFDIPYKLINEANLSFTFLEEAIANYNLPTIDVFYEDLVFGDYNHRWGYAPFHYEKEYYEKFIFHLNKICLHDLLVEKDNI